jgi:ABC-type uncharacterized transport system permease subunit
MENLIIFSTFASTLIAASFRMATPLIFTSIGGLLSERSGVVNVALEGFMLCGAFVGAVTAYYSASPWLGCLAAILAGVFLASIYAFFVIELKANQIVTGTASNLLAMGTIPFITKVIYDSTGSTPALEIGSRFSWEPLLLAPLLVIIVSLWLNNTYSGLWLNFAGENPAALNSSGISVRKVRWMAVLGSGAFAGLGGASLSLWLSSSYSPLMTGGRGFMALAALIFGKWKPIPTALACLFFGLADALQIRLQGVPVGGVEIPVQFIQILPYLLTIIALAGLFGKSRAPKALGQ